MNNDLLISPIDALIIISWLNAAAPPQAQAFVDASGDGLVSPIDALLVISKLNNPTPETVVRLAEDADRDGKTYDLSLDGRVNFADNSPKLFIAAGQADWVDVSHHVDANGYFSIDNRRLRDLLGGEIRPGTLQLRFSPHAPQAHERAISIELLTSPPMPGLTELAGNEDEALAFDLLADTYAPDSAPASLRATVLAAPAHGTLVNEGGRFVYRPLPDFHGLEELVYQISDGENVSEPTTLSIMVHPINDPPEISQIADQAFNVVDRAIEIPLAVGDADGDALTYFGYATVANPIAEIRDTYGLAYAGDEYYDLTGLKEKWFFGEDGTAYFLLPNGDLVQWQGTFTATGTREALAARLDTAIYEDPAMLVNATPIILAPVSVEVGDGKLTIIPEPGLYGDVDVTVVATDGSSSTQRSFVLSINSVHDDMQAERKFLEDIAERAASVDYESLPGLYEDLALEVDTLPSHVGARVTDLLRQLAQIRQDQNDRLRGSQQWTVDQTRIAQLELSRLESLISDLEVLQTEYASAWSEFQSQMDTNIRLDENMPPLFLNGNQYDTPIQVRRGETLLLDLRAVHPLGEPMYTFVNYQDRPGHARLVLHQQTGLFVWPVPAHASGIHDFTVKAALAGRQATVSFQVQVIPNEPSVASLEIRPGTVTDKGTDAITLVAHGVTHPVGIVDEVDFFQDRNGDGIFQETVDSWLGTARPIDGWAWTGLPFALEQGTTATFFARAEYSGEAATLFSTPTPATAPVLRTIDLDIAALRSDSDLISLGTITINLVGDTPSTRTLARYGENQGAAVSYDGSGLYVQRLHSVNAVGRGTNSGPRVKIGTFRIQDVIARADSAGNLTIAFTAGDGSAPDGTTEPSIWLARFDSQNQPIGTPAKLMSAPGDGFVFTMDMNESGQGVIAWKGYYAAPEVFLQTFTSGGAQLGPLHRLEYEGGFHDGGEWNSSAVNASGDYVVAWPKYAVFAKVTDVELPTVTFTDYLPQYYAKQTAAAITRDGWVVLVTDSESDYLGQYPEAQVFDPSGRKVGFPVRTTQGIDLARGYIPYFEVRFASDTELQILWLRELGGGRYDVVRRSFELIRQDDLVAESVGVDAGKLPVAGQTVDVSYRITNTGSHASGQIGAAFYLSHDDVLTRFDRLLATVTMDDGVAAHSTGEFTASIQLPVEEDPIWARGTTALRLIMALPAANEQVSAIIPFVKTTLRTVIVPPSTPPDTGGVGASAETLSTGPKFIRPGVVAAQNGPAGFTKSVYMMELIASQFLSAARSLWWTAPYSLQGEIGQMMADVQVRLDTFLYDAFTLRQARDATVAAAAKIRDDALGAAKSAEATGVSTANAAFDAVVKANQPRIDAEQNRFESRVATTKSAIQQRLNVAKQQLSALEGTEQQIDAVAAALEEEQAGFSLADPRDWTPPSPREVVEDVVASVQQGVQILSQHHAKLKGELKSTLEPLVNTLEAKLANVTNIVQQQINQAVAPFKEAIAGARSAFDAAVKSLEEQRRALEARARKVYDDAIAELPDLGDEIAKVSTSAMPGLSRVGDKLSGVVASIRSPGGLLETARKTLQSQCCEENPFGRVDDILGGTLVAREIVDTVMKELGETLEPAFDQLRESGGKFSDWAKERGGALSDWTKEAHSTVQDWQADRWKAFEEWILSVITRNSTEIYRIQVLPPDENGVYTVRGYVSPYDEDLTHALHWTIEREGQVVLSQYVPLGEQYQKQSYLSPRFEQQFTADAGAPYTITLAFKDRNDKWFETASGLLDLSLHTPPVDIFVDASAVPCWERPDCGVGTVFRPSASGGSPTGGSAEDPVFVDPVPSAAELRRGFPLPYLLASAGVRAEEREGEVDYYFGVDLVEATEESEVEVVFGRVNNAGSEVSTQGETLTEFTRRIDAEIAYQTSLREAYEAFPAWFAQEYNKTLQTDHQQTNELREGFGYPPLSFDEYMRDQNVRHYEEFFPGSIGTLDDAMGAETKLQELRSQSWTQDTLPSFLLKGAAIADGIKLPSEVTNTTSGTQWSISVTAKEAANSRRELTRFTDRINTDLLDKARSKGAAEWQEIRSLVDGAAKASRDNATLRALRAKEVTSAINAAFETSREEAEDLFGMAVPGFGFFVSAGRTMMYAKEGNIADAFVEGAFALLDVLSLGGAGELTGKFGKLIPNPFKKDAPRVIELGNDFAQEGSEKIAKAMRDGATRLSQIAAKFKESGMDPRHAKKLHQFVVDTERMAVVRASNKLGLDYQSLARLGADFKPKPESLKFKTDLQTGLVRGSERNGKFVDARGNITHYTLRHDQQGLYAIYDPEGNNTGFFLRRADGAVMDAGGNQFFADYDLMGVYEKSTTALGKYQPASLGQYNPQTKRWEPGQLLEQMNRKIDDVLDMFQHGGNDEFWLQLEGEVRPGHTAIGEQFFVFHPNGLMEIVNLAALKEIYQKRGINWPY